LLAPREQRHVDDAKRDIARAGKQVVPGRVVAALRFGFWTSILDRAYGNAIWTPNNPAVLVQQAFPFAPPHFQVRARAHDRFNTIRQLRNRVFHYEPIWRGIVLQNNRSVSLLDVHTDILDAIGWVSPTLQATTVAFDRFPNVYQHGRIMVGWNLKQQLGLPI